MIDDSQDKQVVANKGVKEKKDIVKAVDKLQIEKRRRKVRDYVIKGFSYRDISERLGVCYNTIKNDIYAIREELKQKTGPKGSILIEQLRTEINQKLKLVEKTCWQLFEKREVRKYIDRDLVAKLIGLTVKNIKEEKAVAKITEFLVALVEDIGKLKGMMVPQESRVELLRLVNLTINNVMKANKIIGPQTLNLTQINIGKVEHNLSIAKYSIELLIKNFVPEDKRIEAIKKLKQLEWKPEDE